MNEAEERVIEAAEYVVDSMNRYNVNGLYELRRRVQALHAERTEDNSKENGMKFEKGEFVRHKDGYVGRVEFLTRGGVVVVSWPDLEGEDVHRASWAVEDCEPANQPLDASLYEAVKNLMMEIGKESKLHGHTEINDACWWVDDAIANYKPATVSDLAGAGAAIEAEIEKRVEERMEGEWVVGSEGAVCGQEYLVTATGNNTYVTPAIYSHDDVWFFNDCFEDDSAKVVAYMKMPKAFVFKVRSQCKDCAHYEERDGADACWEAMRFDPICGMAGCEFKHK